MRVLRNLALISAACLAFSGTVPVLPAVSAAAAEESAVSADACGEQVTWTLVDGTLTVSGSGDMFDYVTFPDIADKYSPDRIAAMHADMRKNNKIDMAELPWADRKDEIRKVIVKNGVTSVGTYAFNECPNLESVELDGTVTKIGERAFRCCSSLRSLKLPDALRTVGEAAFSQCGLTEIVLPQGTETIGDKAFISCRDLGSVTLPDSIRTIGCDVFYDTKWLKDRKAEGGLIIEGGVLIGYGGEFHEDIIIPDGVRIIGGSALNSVSHELNGGANVKKITIPYGVETICDNAFSNCSNTEEIVIPASVREIGDNAFINCYALKEVTLPENIRSIGDDAFACCACVTEVTIPRYVRLLGSGAFRECAALQTVTILNPDMEIPPVGDNFSNSSTDVFGTFSGVIRGYAGSTAEAYAEKFGRTFESLGEKPQNAPCGEQVTWTLEDGTLTVSGKGDMYDYVSPPHYVTAVPGQHTGDITPEEQEELDGLAGLFGPNEVSLSLLPWGKRTDEIKRIVIGDGVTGIGRNTFSNCYFAESITIADSVTDIRDNAFDHCQCLQSLTLPKNLKTIGESAFSHCGLSDDGMDTLRIPEGTESIGKDAFSYCTKLTFVSLPDSLQYVGIRAFQGTRWFDYKQGQETFIVEGGVLLGYGGKFRDSIVIPDGVRVIGGGALEYAAYNSLGQNTVLKITVPEGVETLCDFAFCWCGDAMEIALPSTLKTIHDSAFYNCFALQKISLPEGMEMIGDHVFGNCESLTEITLPKSVTALGAGAFERCNTLKTVTILNPDMKIDGENETFTNGDEPSFRSFSGTLRGYAGSTAEAYAKQYDRKFEAIAEAPAEVSAGDVNCDSRIDVSDAVLLARFLTADKDAVVLEAGIQNADVDKNGKPDSDDLTALLRFIAKKIKL